jgi:hypothetical protein
VREEKETRGRGDAEKSAINSTLLPGVVTLVTTWTHKNLIPMT